MNHIKAFFREKGLYLICLALVFAATAAGILALRSVVNNLAGLTTRNGQQALQEDDTWDQPDTTVTNPASDVPEPTSTPSAAPSAPASSSGAPSGSAAASPAPAAAAVPSASDAGSSALWRSDPLVEFSGNELVYNETLADWRTHNGVDYAAQPGEKVTPVCAGKVTAVTQDALWGGVVEITDADGAVWRYCGLTDLQVKAGAEVTAGDALGTVGELPAEAHVKPHIHLECLKEGVYQCPVVTKK